MKRHTWLLLAAGFSLLACDNATYIHLSPTAISCDRPGRTDSLSVVSDGDWRVAYAPQWVSVEKRGESTLRYTVRENRTRRTRTDSIVVVAGRLRKAVAVEECGSAKYAVVDDSTLVFKSQGDERDIRVGTDGCYMHVSLPPYMKYYRQKDGIHLVVRANRTADREGTIIITVDSLQRHIHFRQEILPHLRATRQQAETRPAPTPAEAPTPLEQEAETPKKRGNCRKCGGRGTIPDEYGMGELDCDECGGTGSYH